MCSLCLVLRLRPVCPMYHWLHVQHLISYIPSLSYCSVSWFPCSNLYVVFGVLKTIFISVFWNKLVVFLIAGLWYRNMARFFLFLFSLSTAMFFWVLLLILIFRFILFCSFCIVLVGNPLLWAISEIVSSSLILACFVIGRLYARWNSYWYAASLCSMGYTSHQTIPIFKLARINTEQSEPNTD